MDLILNIVRVHGAAVMYKYAVHNPIITTSFENDVN